MRLVNFAVVEPFEGVLLVSSGTTWDLHGDADFEGLEFSPAADSLTLRWRVGRPRVGQTSAVTNPASRQMLRIVFHGVRLLKMHAPDGEGRSPANEISVHGISYVYPGEKPPSLRVAKGDVDGFNLYFEFTSGRTLEIGAHAAELLTESL